MGFDFLPGAEAATLGPPKCGENIVNSVVLGRGHYHEFSMKKGGPGLPKVSFELHLGTLGHHSGDFGRYCAPLFPHSGLHANVTLFETKKVPPSHSQGGVSGRGPALVVLW